MNGLRGCTDRRRGAPFKLCDACLEAIELLMVVCEIDDPAFEFGQGAGSLL